MAKIGKNEQKMTEIDEKRIKHEKTKRPQKQRFYAGKRPF